MPQNATWGINQTIMGTTVLLTSGTLSASDQMPRHVPNTPIPAQSFAGPDRRNRRMKQISYEVASEPNMSYSVEY